MTAAAEPAQEHRPIGRFAGAAVIALIAGFGVLQMIQYGIAWLWEDAPEALGSGPLLWGYVVGLPALAGFAVAALRRRYDGHNPLAGFAFGPVSLAALPFVLGAILVTLWGGLVLGPEVAVITTGSFVGTMFGRGLSNKVAQQMIGIGGLFGLLSLAVRPVLGGSQRFVEDYSFAARDLLIAAGVAAVSAAFIALVRLFAGWLQRVRGGDPATGWQIALGGAAVGGLALAYHLLTDEPVYLIMTSGEGYLRDITAMTSVGLVLVTVAVKTLAYAISLGSGFRGGPYFPVFFLGAGIGTAAALQFDESFVAVAAAAGLIAATVSLAHAGWPVTVGIGLGIGWMVGGFALVPVGVVAAVIGRLVPHPAEGGSGAASQSADGDAEHPM
jgi:H+/Cl- antiporter ClcA